MNEVTSTSSQEPGIVAEVNAKEDAVLCLRSKLMPRMPRARRAD